MKTEFEKNIYCPNEVAKAIVKIDNTECKVDCSNIVFAVEQRISVNIDHHASTHTKPLVTSTVEGPKAGESKDCVMELDLSKIRTDVPHARNKKGKVKPYSKEDKHMIGGIQPASRTKFCANDYSLTTKVSYDNCCGCCDNLPDGSLPMTIVPLVNPECFGF